MEKCHAIMHDFETSLAGPGIIKIYMFMKLSETDGLLWNIFVFMLLLKSPKENKLFLYLSVVAMREYMRYVIDKLIGSPIAKHYLEIVSNRFFCKNLARRTAAQNIMSKNLYKILANWFFLVSIRLNNIPLAIRLNANCSTIFLRSAWEKCCLRFEKLNVSRLKWSLDDYSEMDYSKSSTERFWVENRGPYLRMKIFHYIP